MQLPKTILILLILFQLKSNGQNFISTIDSLERKDNFYQYEDKQKKRYYSSGWIEQIYPAVFFRTVSLDKKTSTLTLVGITTLFFDPDTVRGGQGGFDVLVGQEDKIGNLKNVRYYKQTNNKLSGDTSKPEGYFCLKIKVHTNDILIIGTPGAAGAGAIAYYIGRLLKLD